MISSEVKERVKLLKQEIDTLKIGKTGKRSPIPRPLIQKVIELLHYYSQKDLAQKLGISPSLISKAKSRGERSVKNSTKPNLATSHKFIKVDKKEKNINLASAAMKGKVILEVVTSSGVKVMLYE